MDIINTDQAESARRVYGKLPKTQQCLLQPNINRLCKDLNRCGPSTAIEILAALGRLMVQEEIENGQKTRARQGED